MKNLKWGVAVKIVGKDIEPKYKGLVGKVMWADNFVAELQMPDGSEIYVEVDSLEVL